MAVLSMFREHFLNNFYVSVQEEFNESPDRGGTGYTSIYFFFLFIFPPSKISIKSPVHVMEPLNSLLFDCTAN